ncbi:MAG: hypothetical protein IBJ09_15495 [Bacteroidia bacterium]|nr:hypothetical protein [Bacteroidia bacterium]
MEPVQTEPLGKTLIKIPLAEAVDLTQNWVEYTQLNKPFEPHQGAKRAFKVSKEDIIALTNQEGFCGIRVYLGKDTPDAEGDMRLVLVAVNEEGDDIIVEPNPGVYDFSMPCPSTCDLKSPLYTGILPPPEQV